jgi:hypothetical protein
MPGPRHARAITLAGAIVLAAAAAVVVAFTAAAGAGPSPAAANGAPVALFASGVPTPTAFAWDGSTMFVGEGPADPNMTPGGLFTLPNGAPTRVPGSPDNVYGLAWHYGSLYVSAGPTIEKLSGWDGTQFASIKTIWSGSPKFYRFNGIAFGPDGRLYAGLGLKEPDFDHTKDPYPLSQAVVSMTAAGKQLRILARGIRQPFQLTFPPGSRWPYVTDLGQDAGAIPPDEIVVAKPGQNYGFPTCTWLILSKCKGFVRPKFLLPAHASPMGIGSIGHTLYVALFNGIGDNGFNPEVVTIPAGGGTPTPFLTGIDNWIIALGIHAGKLYVGDVNGQVFEVAL